MWRSNDPLRRAVRGMRAADGPVGAMAEVVEVVWTRQPPWRRRAVAFSRGYAAVGLLALLTGALAPVALRLRPEPWPDGWHRGQLHVRPKALADLVGPNIHADALAALERVQAAFAASPRIHIVQYGAYAEAGDYYAETWIEGERLRRTSQSGDIRWLTVETGEDALEVRWMGEEVMVNRGGMCSSAEQARSWFVEGLLNIHLHGYVDEVSLARATLEGYAQVAEIVIRGRNRMPHRVTLYFDLDTALPIFRTEEYNMAMDDRYDNLALKARIYYEYPDNIDDRLFDIERAAASVEESRQPGEPPAPPTR